MAARNFAVSISKAKEEDESYGEKANQLIKLRSLGFLTPQTFLVTPKAYFEFIKSNDLDKKISHLLGVVDFEKAKSVQDIASHIEKYLTKSEIPNHILKDILYEYKNLGGLLNHAKANVFLSHVKNGLKVHKVTGDASLINEIKNHWFSIYSPKSPKTNPTIVIQKIEKGKNGKIKTSTKQVQTPFNLNKEDVEALEALVSKFKKEFYFPHEIDFVINGDKVFVLKITPETSLETHAPFPEYHFSIIRNSHNL